MDLSRTFRRLMFAQVLLGFVSFCLAEGNLPLLLVVLALSALSWYVSEGPRGRPLPHWAILIASFTVIPAVFVEVFYLGQRDPILAVGHFTIWLQVVQLYARKQNRERALLLVLSLLQMVGACVIGDSLLFGLLLLLYCALALVTVMLYQCMATADRITAERRRAAPDGEQAMPPQAIFGRGYRAQLRLTTTAIGLACAAIAVMVFLITPRGEPPLHSQRVGATSSARQIGFNPVELRLGSSPQEGSAEPVLYVRLERNGVGHRAASGSFLLRGAVFDTYDIPTRTWSRDYWQGLYEKPVDRSAKAWVLAKPPAQLPRVTATITVRGEPTSTLFTLQPPVAVDSRQIDGINFSPLDQVLTARSTFPRQYHVAGIDESRAPQVYAAYVESLPELNDVLSVPNPDHPPRRGRRGRTAYGEVATSRPADDRYARGWWVEYPDPNADLNILATRVVADAGLRLDSRGRLIDPADGQDAVKALSDHLGTRCNYSLDFVSPSSSVDPMTDFLFHQKTGHCEYFAATLAAMSRSVGVPARVATGYIVHEYNHIGGYYIVRGRDAHAWTEVWLGPRGWVTVDASPPAALALETAPSTGLFAWLNQLYDHGQFVWQKNVVGFDSDNVHDFLSGSIQKIKSLFTDRSTWFGALVGQLVDWISSLRFTLTTVLAGAVILILIIVGATRLLRFLAARRRRLAALQIMRLPARQRRQLARQLSFYLDMLELLERHGFRRPEWQSPFSFAQDLLRRDPTRFAPVLAMTESFYEVRFGHRSFDAPRREAVLKQLRLLETSLAA